MFLTSLQVKAAAPDEWELLFNLVWQTEANTVVVPQGFITDLASIPRPLRGILDINGKSRRPAVLHDWLYCCSSQGTSDGGNTYDMTRKDADSLLREALIADGCSRFTAWVYYQGVRIGGGRYWQKRKQTGLTKEDFA